MPKFGMKTEMVSSQFKGFPYKAVNNKNSDVWGQQISINSRWVSNEN